MWYIIRLTLHMVGMHNLTLYLVFIVLSVSDGTFALYHYRSSYYSVTTVIGVITCTA